MISPRTLVRTAGLAALIAWPVPAGAGVIVVPNSLTAAEGDGAIGAGPDIRYQQVHGASDFGGLGVIQITGLALRPDAGSGDPFGPDTLPGLQVRLSTTARAPDGLSTTFADNVGADETIVFDGDWTRSSADAPGPGGTRAFDIVLSFMTPFTYDPAGGSLLVDFIDASSPFGSVRMFPLVDAQNVFGDSVSAIAGRANESTGFDLGGAGVVVQFAFQAQAVPEPTSLVLSGTGALGLCGVAWRRRKRAAVPDRPDR